MPAQLFAARNSQQYGSKTTRIGGRLFGRTPTVSHYASLITKTRLPPTSELGVDVGEDELPKAAKVGSAVIVTRGDAATRRAQLCYASCDPSKPVHLIFESGEVQYAFYLFEDGLKWNGNSYCAESKLVTPDLSTKSGLRLGQTPSEVEAILGGPTARRGDELLYFRQIRKKTSERDLRKLREYHSNLSEKEFYENYDFYDFTVYIKAIFRNSRLTYLAISESETN